MFSFNAPFQGKRGKGRILLSLMAHCDITIVIVLTQSEAGTDLGSSHQLVTLCTAVQVIALKQLFLYKHVPQSLLQARHATNTCRQVQEVLLKKTQKTELG